MKVDPELIEDLLNFGSAAMDHFFEAKHGAKSALLSHLEVATRRLNLVTREEFDTAFAMLAKARLRQEEIVERLSAVEKKLNISPKKKSAKSQSGMILKKKKTIKKR